MTSQNGKNPMKLEITYEIKIKRSETRQNWKEERKKTNREKDYGRLRSVKKWEEKSKKEKWKKKAKLKR